MESKIRKLKHRVVNMRESDRDLFIFAVNTMNNVNEIIDSLNSQSQPEEKEEWEKRFIRTFGYWGEEIKFIKQLLKERELEVWKEASSKLKNNK